MSKRRRLQKRYVAKYISQNGLQVSNGPFAGLLYVSQAAGSSLLNKLIGCYEEPLHSYLEKIKLDSYDTIVDIGCAEGYYLIGLGISFPHAHLVGFDSNSQALKLASLLAEKNNIGGRLQLKRTCTFETLEKSIVGETLLICDAEGFETEILNPILSPKLAQIKTIIVETHDHKKPGASDTVKNRFQSTHIIETITLTPANPDHYDFLRTQVDPAHLIHILKERTTKDQKMLVLNKKDTSYA